ncbi:MAG: hypothetical protein ACP5HM_10620 [Anaerolineae bacterium]
MTKKKQRPDRFPLLVYPTMVKSWRGPAFWLIPAGVALWWAARHSEMLRYAWLGFVLSGVGALIFLYTLLAGRAAVRCHTRHFTVVTPLYPVVFSYWRVEAVRPVEFATLYPPQKEKAARQRLYRQLWGKTAVVLDLKGYPLPKGWLRLWLHPYLFHPKHTGLVLLTEDWMALIRQIETRRTELKSRRAHS